MTHPATVPNLDGKPRPVIDTRIVGGRLYAGYQEHPTATRLSWTPVSDPTRKLTAEGERDVY